MTACPQMIAVMTPFPHAVRHDTPLNQAREFMREHNVRHLPVTRDGELAGIISDRDITLMLGPDLDYPDAEEVTVDEACVHQAFVVDVSARLDSVLSVMVERHLDAVVITRSVSTGDKLAGIFTTTDACREFAATLARQYAIDGNSAA